MDFLSEMGNGVKNWPSPQPESSSDVPLGTLIDPVHEYFGSGTRRLILYFSVRRDLSLSLIYLVLKKKGLTVRDAFGVCQSFGFLIMIRPIYVLQQSMYSLLFVLVFLVLVLSTRVILFSMVCVLSQTKLISTQLSKHSIRHISNHSTQNKLLNSIYIIIMWSHLQAMRNTK